MQKSEISKHSHEEVKKVIQEQLSRELDSLVAKEKDFTKQTAEGSNKSQNHYERLSQEIMTNFNYGLIKKHAFSPKVCKEWILNIICFSS